MSGPRDLRPFLDRLFKARFDSGTSPETQGLSGMYDLLVTAGLESPVQGNADGSYLTMKSNQGLVFGAATILSGFSGVFCDQGKPLLCRNDERYPMPLAGYWQRVRYTVLSLISQSHHQHLGYCQPSTIHYQSLCESHRSGIFAI